MRPYQAADVVILNDNLQRVAETVTFSRRTHAILWQNITVAVEIKAVFSCLRFLAPRRCGWGIRGHGAGLPVVANGLRLLRGAQPAPKQKGSLADLRYRQA